MILLCGRICWSGFILITKASLYLSPFTGLFCVYLNCLRLFEGFNDILQRKNSPVENGYRHLGPNRARTKPVFHILFFHFQIRSKYWTLSNQSFSVHPIHINNQFKLNVIYEMHSGDGIHLFLRKQSFLWTIWLSMTADSSGKNTVLLWTIWLSMTADVFAVIWHIVVHLYR